VADTARFLAALESHRLVALDTSLFIYHMERHPTYLPLTRLLFQRLEQGLNLAEVSVLLVTEILTAPKRVSNPDLVRAYERLLHEFPNLQIRAVDWAVAELAADLRARFDLRTPDALHLASAVVHGAKAFVTNDRRLARITDVAVLCLSDYV
jgi:predicted nucleic acid-binding protein